MRAGDARLSSGTCAAVLGRLPPGGGAGAHRLARGPLRGAAIRPRGRRRLLPARAGGRPWQSQGPGPPPADTGRGGRRRSEPRPCPADGRLPDDRRAQRRTVARQSPGGDAPGHGRHAARELAGRGREARNAREQGLAGGGPVARACLGAPCGRRRFRGRRGAFQGGKDPGRPRLGDAAPRASPPGLGPDGRSRPRLRALPRNRVRRTRRAGRCGVPGGSRGCRQPPGSNCGATAS